MSSRRIAVLLGISLALVLVLDLLSGSSSCGISGMLQALKAGPGANTVMQEVVWQIRLPRVLASLLAGSVLAVSGFQMQTLFRNPLAGPYELGLSAGAGVGVAGFVLMGWQGPSFISQAGLLGAAALGALGVMALLISLAPLLRSTAALLLAGLLLSSGLGALIAGMQAFSGAEALQSFVNWTLGSMEGVTWGQLAWLAPVCLSGLLAAVFGTKPLTALMLGEDEARSLGSRVRATRLWTAVCAGVLAAAVTAFCGPIAFIGLGMPHVARWLLGRTDPRALIPGSALLGATALLLCDAISQTIIPGRVLPVNIVASALGAPLALLLLLRYQRRNDS
jgi:iron complex transport system permease protein